MQKIKNIQLAIENVIYVQMRAEYSLLGVQLDLWVNPSICIDHM